MRRAAIICMVLMYLIFICVILYGCTFNYINREYPVKIIACKDSNVYFDPEILTDIKKKSEAESTQKTDVRTDADLTGPY